MKKNFTLTDPKLPDARRIEAVKHEIKKYVKRERNKPLKNDGYFWSFECRVGATEETAQVIHVGDINQCIDGLVAQGETVVYVEILASMAKRRTPND